jgi:hypothetical protein
MQVELGRLYHQKLQAHATQIMTKAMPVEDKQDSAGPGVPANTPPNRGETDMSASEPEQGPVSLETTPDEAQAIPQTEPESSAGIATLMDATAPLEDSAPAGEIVMLEGLPVAEPAPTMTEKPMQQSSRATVSTPEATTADDGTFDLVVGDKPEVQSVQRAQRLLAGARIPVRSLRAFAGWDGKSVVGIILANPMQKDSARALLRQAGIPLE